MRERSDFAELLDALEPEQWNQPSLCDEWTVHDVVNHTVMYLGQSVRQLAINMVRNRWNINQLNARALRDHKKDPAELIELMRNCVEPSGAGALYGSRVALIECLIHQQDVRRPLGIPRVIAEDRLRVSLDYARISPVIGGARRTHGLRLVATDMEWSAGRGPEIRGRGEALLLAMTGRAAKVLDELEGEGRALR